MVTVRVCIAAAFVAALVGCERSRECYPMCPNGYAPAPGCKCAPLQSADAGASAAPSASNRR